MNWEWMKAGRRLKSPHSQKPQTIFRCFPLLFLWLGILRAKRNDIAGPTGIFLVFLL